MSQEGKFRLEVVTPARSLVSEMVDEITAPGVEGEFGVLAGHTPFLTELGYGLLVYRTVNQMHVIGVRKGFAEVTREKVTVLAEEADFPKEIDIAKAEAELAEAEKSIRELSSESKEYIEAKGKIDRALNQIHLVKGVRHG